jgi:hypothetical protein
MNGTPKQSDSYGVGELFFNVLMLKCKILLPEVEEKGCVREWLTDANEDLTTRQLIQKLLHVQTTQIPHPSRQILRRRHHPAVLIAHSLVRDAEDEVDPELPRRGLIEIGRPDAVVRVDEVLETFGHDVCALVAVVGWDEFARGAGGFDTVAEKRVGFVAFHTVWFWT